MLSVPSKFEKDETSLSWNLFRIETQFGADWTKPGCGSSALLEEYRGPFGRGCGGRCNGPLQPPIGGRTGGYEKRYYSLAVYIIEVVSIHFYIPPKSPKGGLHFHREALMAPTECYAKRSVEHTHRIKHQTLNSNQPSKSEYMGRPSKSRLLFV